jgi:hypothetical protein
MFLDPCYIELVTKWSLEGLHVHDLDDLARECDFQPHILPSQICDGADIASGKDRLLDLPASRNRRGGLTRHDISFDWVTLHFSITNKHVEINFEQ